MKQRVSLLEVCKLPDVQLHSKTAFFKSIINKQSEEAIATKDQIIKLSYTVKTIGVQGEQVGIVSKRLPLKFKKPLVNEPQKETLFQRNFIPHTSFYSQALIPIRKQKHKPQSQSVVQSFKSNLNFMITNHKLREHNGLMTRSPSIKRRAQSNSKINTIYKKKKEDEDIHQLGKITSQPKINKNSSNGKKKSFSNLLRQCNSQQKQFINPLFHEENPFFKKIQKIKKKFSQKLINTQRMRYDSIQRVQSNQSSCVFQNRIEKVKKE